MIARLKRWWRGVLTRLGWHKPQAIAGGEIKAGQLVYFTGQYARTGHGNDIAPVVMGTPLTEETVTDVVTHGRLVLDGSAATSQMPVVVAAQPADTGEYTTIVKRGVVNLTKGTFTPTELE